MKKIVNCLSCVNNNKIIVEELVEKNELNGYISSEELLNHLQPLILKNPIAYVHYETLCQHINKIQSPTMIMENEKAYLWLLHYYN